MAANPDYEKAYCPKIQASLNALCQNSPYGVQSFETGAFDAITSAYNQADWQTITMSNKKPLIQLLYQNRPLPSSVTAGAIDLCPVGAANPYLETEITLEEGYNSAGVELEEGELKNICLDETGAKAKILYGQIAAVKAKINDAIIAAMGLNVTNSYGPVAPQAGPPKYNFAVQLINNGTVDVTDWGIVLRQMRLLGCSAPPILIGDHQLFDLISFNKYGCCNTGGFNTGDITGQAAFFLDPKIGETAGLGLDATPYFVGLVPGAVTLASWNPYTVPFVDPKGNETGTIIDPATGQAFTYRIRFEECTGLYSAGKWIFSVHLMAGIFFRPSDFYAVGDPLEGTNGMLVFKQV